MINFDNVSFAFGEKQILKNFNLSIKKGDRLCIMGESGRGKTTLLRLIMGLETANSGTVTVDSNKFGVVFQEDRLLPFKTVKENLTLFGNEATAKSHLACLGIADAENLYPSSLSGGMARRVAIARAFIGDRDIYILDECFNGLDAENIKKTAEFIRKNTEDKTVIAVSHDPQHAKLLNLTAITL